MLSSLRSLPTFALSSYGGQAPTLEMTYFVVYEKKTRFLTSILYLLIFLYCIFLLFTVYCLLFTVYWLLFTGSRLTSLISFFVSLVAYYFEEPQYICHWKIVRHSIDMNNVRPHNFHYPIIHLLIFLRHYRYLE